MELEVCLLIELIMTKEDIENNIKIIGESRVAEAEKKFLQY